MDPAAKVRWSFEGQLKQGRNIMEIVRIGLDLAKNVFEVCGVDMRDHVVLRKTLRRDALPQFFAELPPCLVGMEACSSSHYFRRGRGTL